MPAAVSEQSDADRLARVEAQNESIVRNLADLTAIVQDMRKAQGELADKFALIGRWDAKTILSMFGLVLTPVVAMWGLAIAPIQQELTLHRLYQERLDQRANENAHSIVQMNEKFVEIETQFRQGIEHQNIGYETLEGRVAELWKAEFNREMSRKTEFPGIVHETK